MEINLSLLDDYEPISVKSSKESMLAIETFTPEICDEIVRLANDIPDGYWVNRLKINSKPTKGISECNYWFLGDLQQPKPFREFLYKLAPLVNGAKPSELILNRYELGEGMPEHIDFGPYRANWVVSLCEDGDGIEIEGKFYTDRKGFSNVFPMRSPPHEVPKVKTKRFVLIYLYE